MRKIFFAVIACGVLVAAFGCKKEVPVQKVEIAVQSEKQETAPLAQESEMPVIREIRANEVGRDVFCPVMGNAFKTEAGGIAADYKGMTVYLCCAGCVDPIKKNPDKYFVPAEKVPVRESEL